jgi:hypothetical protein
MAYEDEGSSQSASSNWAKNREADDFDEFFKKDKKSYDNRIITTLSRLARQGSIYTDLSQYNNQASFIYAVDGSNIPFESFNEYGHAIKVGVSIGAAFLDINDLANPQINRFGTPNPEYYANLYGHKNNLFLAGLLPAKNIFFEQDNGGLLSQKQSYLIALNKMLSKDGFSKQFLKHTIDEFNLIPTFISCKESDNDCELKNSTKAADCINRGFCKKCARTPVETISPILNLTRKIQDEVIHHNALNESQELMLVLENLLATYIIKHSHHQNLLVVLDGRLDNYHIGEFIGVWLEIYNQNHGTETLLVGVQKSGLLNKYLTDIHEVLKHYPLNQANALGNLVNNLHQNNFENSILIVLDDQAKMDLGLPYDEKKKTSIKKGEYGMECLYLSKGIDKKEFVFTVPSHLMSGVYANNLKGYLSKITNTIENTHTNLYLKSHGALLPNILAHDNVSLNRKLTNRVEETKDKQMNLHQSGKKPKT